MSARFSVKLFLAAFAASAVLLPGCASKPPKAPDKPAPPVAKPASVLPPLPPVEKLPPVMTGIDVLEADRFAAVAGKKIGLLTHPAGVNRRGDSTIDVLRRAPGVKLVALFAPEHGLWGLEKAGENFEDTVDKRTGLPVYSLYGKNNHPTKAQLKGLDALVVDLQDIGVRSYTFNVVMRYAMESCFENNVEVIVLDRPNPLGGFKVDGPSLDADLMSGVGAFRVPYVHGLTMGELATMAKQAPNVLATTEKIRQRGKLTVIPMRGWTRSMRWPDTGLKWVATSTFITSYEAVMGYAMVGLGTQNSGWTWGIGKDFPFRGIGYPKKTPDEIIAALNAYRIPGIRLTKQTGVDKEGKPITGVYVHVTDGEAWRPTELAFYMHKQAALWSRLNPFATLTPAEQRTFKIHVGSAAWLSALSREGGKVNVASFIQNWTERAKIYQDATRKYWLYQ
ncbi:MAG: hypothetical protein JWQ83_1916 [Lacunisphaera sp.]|nr:hypothetical protein [Lacunisphaera sp.]